LPLPPIPCYYRGMTEIRRLAAGEIPQLDRIHTVVYNQRRDFPREKPGEDGAKDEPSGHPPHWAWGAFEKGRLLSCMREIDFLMSFDGGHARMSGIGGVGTLPEARKGGLVRRIFEKLLPEARESGVVFSTLTPFSHDYYRMFGYEIACARNNVSIPARDFLGIKPRGEFVQVFPGDDTGALQEVHSAYIGGLNHGIRRDHWPDGRAWREFTENDPYATGIFLYLWKDDDGKPRGYVKYKDEDNGGEGHAMSVVELAFADREGLYGVLGIVGGLSAQFRSLKWPMPTFVDPCDFTGNAWEIDQSISPRDMTRVVNVGAALGMMRRPPGEGAYVVEVEDANLAANSGRYLVEFGPGETRVSPTQKGAHLRCDIRALSQLVTGYRALENAVLSRRSGLEVCGNLETLSRVFTLRPQHVTEYF